MKFIIPLLFSLFSWAVMAKRSFYNFKWPKSEIPIFISCSLYEMEDLEMDVKDINLMKKAMKEGVPELTYKLILKPKTKLNLKFSRGFLGEQNLVMEIEKLKWPSKKHKYRFFHKYTKADGALIDKGEMFFPAEHKMSSYFIKPEGAFVQVVCNFDERLGKHGPRFW